jgi:hypothetical protein
MAREMIGFDLYWVPRLKIADRLVPWSGTRQKRSAMFVDVVMSEFVSQCETRSATLWALQALQVCVNMEPTCNVLKHAVERGRIEPTSIPPDVRARIVACYREDFDREPTEQELRELLEFCGSGPERD